MNIPELLRRARNNVMKKRLEILEPTISFPDPPKCENGNNCYPYKAKFMSACIGSGL
jgi:hypothetical protein